MKAIVTGDAEYAARSFDDLPPGSHVALRASPSQLPDSGLALRLAGFEIRDTIAHIVGDRIVWWILARKPLDGTVAANVLAHGVGGLNIDACRVPSDAPIPSHHGTSGAAGVTMGKYRDYVPGSETAASVENVQTAGRFPANVLLDEHAAKEMDKQSGNRPGAVSNGSKTTEGMNGSSTFKIRAREQKPGYADNGGASRFFPLLDEDEAENWIRRLIDPDRPA